MSAGLRSAAFSASRAAVTAISARMEIWSLGRSGNARAHDVGVEDARLVHHVAGLDARRLDDELGGGGRQAAAIVPAAMASAWAALCRRDIFVEGRNQFVVGNRGGRGEQPRPAERHRCHGQPSLLIFLSRRLAQRAGKGKPVQGRNGHYRHFRNETTVFRDSSYLVDGLAQPEVENGPGYGAAAGTETAQVRPVELAGAGCGRGSGRGCSRLGQRRGGDARACLIAAGLVVAVILLRRFAQRRRAPHHRGRAHAPRLFRSRHRRHFPHHAGRPLSRRQSGAGAHLWL